MNLFTAPAKQSILPPDFEELKSNKPSVVLGSYQSFSGEPSDGIGSKLLVPFKRYQSEGIIEQYNNGVKLFDFHIRWDKKFKKFVPGNDTWSTGRQIIQIFSELSSECIKNKDRIYYILTLDNEIEDELDPDVKKIMANFNTFASSLSSLFGSIILIEKRINTKRSFMDRLLARYHYKPIWQRTSDDETEQLFLYNILSYSTQVKYKFLPPVCNRIMNLFKSKVSGDVSVIKNSESPDSNLILHYIITDFAV